VKVANAVKIEGLSTETKNDLLCFHHLAAMLQEIEQVTELDSDFRIYRRPKSGLLCIAAMFGRAQDVESIMPLCDVNAIEPTSGNNQNISTESKAILTLANPITRLCFLNNSISIFHLQKATPLVAALMANNLETFRVLLNNDLTSPKDTYGDPIIFSAISLKAINCLSILPLNNMNLQARNKFGDTIGDLLVRNSLRGIIKSENLPFNNVSTYEALYQWYPRFMRTHNAILFTVALAEALILNGYRFGLTDIMPRATHPNAFNFPFPLNQTASNEVFYFAWTGYFSTYFPDDSLYGQVIVPLFGLIALEAYVHWIPIRYTRPIVQKLYSAFDSCLSWLGYGSTTNDTKNDSPSFTSHSSLSNHPNRFRLPRSSEPEDIHPLSLVDIDNMVDQDKVPRSTPSRNLEL